jgi:hypothetical protein
MKGGLFMAEEKSVIGMDLQMFRPYESFRNVLDKEYSGEIVIVEFCCGKFMKKALGCLKVVGADFLELTGTRSTITIDIYGPKGVIDTEKQARKLIIPIDRVCGVELLSRRHCPDPYTEEKEGE